jgi:DNA-directed RNA polymerase specialized sigma24 family protein
MDDGVRPVLGQIPLATHDSSRHDNVDARRLVELRQAITNGDVERARVLMGELIAGWRPMVEGYLAARTGQEVAEEVVSRLELKLLRLLLRKQDFRQAWGKVVWENAKWILSDVLEERQREIERRAEMEDIGAEIGDPKSGFEIEALDERLSIDAGRLYRALARLSDDDRRLLEMIYWEDMEDGAAATKIGIVPGTFAVRKHRAIERLRAAFFAPDVMNPDETPG